jgi:hypothetical protein
MVDGRKSYQDVMNFYPADCLLNWLWVEALQLNMLKENTKHSSTWVKTPRKELSIAYADDVNQTFLISNLIFNAFFSQDAYMELEVKDFALPSYSVKVELPAKVPLEDLTFQRKFIAHTIQASQLKVVQLFVSGWILGYHSHERFMSNVAKICSSRINSAAEVFEVNVDVKSLKLWREKWSNHHPFS